MTESPPVANPFALMMDPEAVLRAVEQSQRLSRLRRRICRPLDKPLLPHADGGDAAEFNHALGDRTVETAD